MGKTAKQNLQFLPTWYGIQATSILLSNSVTEIAGYAFADCLNLLQIVIPTSVVEIDKTAFDGDDYLVIFGYPDSYAETYADLMGYTFVYLEE